MCVYTTSSCSIRTKNKAKQRPGNTSVTTGTKIGGKNAAVISFLVIIYSCLIYFYKKEIHVSITLN